MLSLATRFALLTFLHVSTLPQLTSSFQPAFTPPSINGITTTTRSRTRTTTLSDMSKSSQSATTSTKASQSLAHIKGLHEISNSYQTYLLDMWGVMHNGSTTYDGVIHTIQQLKEQNKKLIILSNSSKRLDNAIKMLTKLGFDPNHDFEQIITSGDVSHRMLSGDKSLRCTTWDVLQNLQSLDRDKNVFVFGSGDADEEYCTSSGWTLSSIDDADLIIARGTFTINDGSGTIVSKKEDQDQYFQVLENMLEQASKKKIPMLVTNPDKVRPDEGLPPMPGAIGDAYEKYLKEDYGEDSVKQLVKRIGKPYSEVYELAMNGCDDPSSVIMVGDALETDITGGKWSQIDSLWVTDDGIHSPAINESDQSYDESVQSVLLEFNDKKGYTGDDTLRPTFVTQHFKW